MTLSLTMNRSKQVVSFFLFSMHFVVYISFPDLRFNKHRILKIYAYPTNHLLRSKILFKTSHAKCHFFSHNTFFYIFHTTVFQGFTIIGRLPPAASVNYFFALVRLKKD